MCFSKTLAKVKNRRRKTETHSSIKKGTEKQDHAGCRNQDKDNDNINGNKEHTVEIEGRVLEQVKR